MKKDCNTYLPEGDSKKERMDEELWFSSLVANDRHKYDVDEAFQRFVKRTTGRTKKTFYRSYRTFIYAAAAVLLLLSVSTVSYWQGGKQLQEDFADIVVEAPLGAKTKLRLPDGTLVWLNAGSRIVYSQGFGMNNRILEFQGEAYFEVKKNEKLPFSVQTPDLNLTVLGTKFNFRDYPEDEEVVVDLLEGRVSLQNCVREMDLCYLSPAEKMVLSKKTGDMEIFAAETEKAKVWTSDILMFDEDLLPDILRKLERAYNVKIQIANVSLEKERFYGSFDRQKQSLYDVLDVLSATGRLEYRIEDKLIIVK